MEPKTFDELNLDGRLKEYLQTMNLKPLSPVEANAIPFLLERKALLSLVLQEPERLFRMFYL